MDGGVVGSIADDFSVSRDLGRVDFELAAWISGLPRLELNGCRSRHSHGLGSARERVKVVGHGLL